MNGESFDMSGRTSVPKSLLVTTPGFAKTSRLFIQASHIELQGFIFIFVFYKKHSGNG